MLEKTVTIVNQLGLHARPSAQVSKTAALFKSKVTLTVGDKTVDAKSILALMTLAAKCGQTVQIVADGPDEKVALSSISELFESGFSEIN